MVRRATIIKQARASAKNVLVLDAGNSLVGDRDPALRTQGQSSVQAMNLMGYNAMALGDMDLRLGLDALKKRQAEASFPLLSANAVTSDGEEPLFKPYTILEMEGHRVGIVGLSNGPDQGGIRLLSPLETARQVVERLQGEADIVVLLSHAGLSTDKEIASSVPGIDVIIGGGQETLGEVYRDPTNGTAIVHADVASAGHTGRQVGVGVLSFDSGGKLLEAGWSKVSLGPEVPDDPDMAAWEEANR